MLILRNKGQEYPSDKAMEKVKNAKKWTSLPVYLASQKSTAEYLEIASQIL
jgi:hypothetical protein